MLAVVGFKLHHIGNLATDTNFFWTHVPNAKDLSRWVFPDYGAKMPLYSALLAFARLFYSDWFALGKLISMLGSIGVLYIIYRFLDRTLQCKRWISVASVLLISANYYFFR